MIRSMLPAREIFLSVAILLLSAHSITAQGFLKVKDKMIVDGAGQPFILRGMGLGGWMLQEGYMFKLSNLGQQYKIREKIQELVGVEKTQQFYEQWLAQHTTKADIDSMAAWGFNSIRLPMHYNLYTLATDKELVPGKQTWLEKGFALTDSLLAWCKANQMYLILDLHATPGGQGNDLAISDRDPAKPSLWDDKANQEKMIALWQKLAQRYVNEKWIGGYDIINEPNWGFEDAKDFRGTAEKKNAPLRALMMDISKAIRAIDTNHIIIIEGNGFGNNYNGVLPRWDNNMVMSFHKYGNFNKTTSIQNFLNLRDTYNIPLWLGESGENSNTWFTEAIGLVESNGIGWAWWQEKKMGINNPLEIKMPAGYSSLLDYWTGKGSRPSEATAWKILQELLHNIRIENTIYHRDVTDAMFRQVHSTAAIPFKQHIIQGTATIRAIDFDLGRQRVAYYDKDSASYHFTPGVNTRGNKGYTYRNDGVDIKDNGTDTFVFGIEEGEWLQYTVNVPAAGRYTISFSTAADSSNGTISLLADHTPLIKTLALPATREQWMLTAVKDIFLDKGIHQLRVYADKGGFNLNSIQFARQ